MNEQERIELLREVARVAPKEMGAEFRDDPYVLFDASSRALDLHQPPLSGDDGDACFVMLDAMEAAGWGIQFGRHNDEPGKHYYAWAKRVAMDGFDIVENCYEFEYGATRAEAISRAFVAVFQN